jgi:hypothetical protein
VTAAKRGQSCQQSCVPLLGLAVFFLLALGNAIMVAL